MYFDGIHPEQLASSIMRVFYFLFFIDNMVIIGECLLKFPEKNKGWFRISQLDLVLNHIVSKGWFRQD